jgi:hypothetical protein
VDNICQLIVDAGFLPLTVRVIDNATAESQSWNAAVSVLCSLTDCNNAPVIKDLLRFEIGQVLCISLTLTSSEDLTETILRSCLRLFGYGAVLAKHQLSSSPPEPSSIDESKLLLLSNPFVSALIKSQFLSPFLQFVRLTPRCSTIAGEKLLHLLSVLEHGEVLADPPFAPLVAPT